MINFSKNVFFIPYKGSKYEQGYKNKRILVLGESIIVQMMMDAQILKNILNGKALLIM